MACLKEKKKKIQNHNRRANRKKKFFSLGALQNAPQLLSLLEDWNIKLEKTLLEIEKFKKINEWKYFYMCKLQFYNENKVAPLEKWLHAVRKRQA